MPGSLTPIALLGTMEWVIIGFVALLLFGATRLPKLARAMGSSVSEFKKGMKEGAEEPEAPAATPETPEAKK